MCLIKLLRYYIEDCFDSTHVRSLPLIVVVVVLHANTLASAYPD
jgi:hypothetical protein